MPSKTGSHFDTGSLVAHCDAVCYTSCNCDYCVLVDQIVSALGHLKPVTTGLYIHCSARDVHSCPGSCMSDSCRR